MRKVRSIQRDGVATDAVITDVRTVRFSKGSVDILKLEYTDARGRRFPAKATVGVGEYGIGQSLQVKYLLNNPGEYSFDNRKTYWAILIFLILLFLFSIFAVYKVNELVKAGNYQFTG